MKYGERLKTARSYAELSQAQLAEMVGVTQSNISQLEKTTGDGSEYTAQLAHACGVSAIWLANETGPMINAYSTNHRIAHAVKIMESLPEAFIDEAVKSVDSLAELASKVNVKIAKK